METIKNNQKIDIKNFDQWLESDGSSFFVYPDYRENMLFFLTDYYSQVNPNLSDDEILKSTRKITDYIKNELKGNLESIDISTLQIVGRNISFSDKNGKEYFFDITPVNSYEDFQEREAKREAKMDKEALKEELNKESYFGGAVIVGYMALAEAGLYTINDIYFKDKLGNKQNIKFDINNSQKGTKVELSKTIIKKISDKGYIFDPIDYTFEKIDSKVTELILKRKGIIKSMTFKEYENRRNQIGEKALTKEKFLYEQQKLTTEIERIDKKYLEYSEKQERLAQKKMSRTKFFHLNDIKTKIGRLGILGTTTQHMLFLPVFLESIHKNHQNLGSYGKALSEYELFRRGSKYGSNVGSKVPGLPGKLLGLAGGLIGGAGFVIGGEEIAHKAGIDKAMRKYLPDKEDFFEKIGLGGEKSIIGHIVFMGAVNDLVDKLGISRNIVINFFLDSEVDLNTNVREYMSIAIGRNVEKYNKEIEKTGIIIKKDIKNLIIDYRESREDFALDEFNERDISEDFIYYASGGKLDKQKHGKNDGVYKNNKKEIFLEKLSDILGYKESESIFDGYFVQAKVSLYEFTEYLLESGSLEKDDFMEKNWKDYDYYVSNVLDYAKIDDSFIKRQKQLQKSKRDTIISVLNGTKNLPELAIIADLSKEKREFIKKLFKRIIAKENLLKNIGETNNFSIYDTKGNGNRQKNLDIKKWGEKNEREKYNELLEIEGFTNFLNFIVEYKRETNYIKTLEKNYNINGEQAYGEEWGI